MKKTEEFKEFGNLLKYINKKSPGEVANLYQQVRDNKIPIEDEAMKTELLLQLADVMSGKCSARKRSRTPQIGLLIGILCIATAIGLAVIMGLSYEQEMKNAELAEAMQSLHSQTDDIEVEDSFDVESGNQMLPALRQIYEINDELCGWLTVPGTKIDYPVVQTEDNEYYLDHDIYGEENSVGTLFLDYRNADSDTNLIIYGHNMKNTEMFGTLSWFEDEEFFQENNKLYYENLYEKHTYRIIAVCRGRVAYEDEDIFRYYDFTDAGSLEEIQQFWKNIEEQSIFEVDYKFKKSDKYITLSTCSKYIDNGRLYIVAVREE